MSNSDISPSFTEAWLAGPDDHQFYTRTFTPSSSLGSSPRAVVLAIHGFAEHITRHEPEHTAWAARGFAVFAYDQRGFGRTALDTAHRSKGAAYGKTSHRDLLRDLEFWIKHAHGLYPALRLFLLAQSMGSALCLAFPTRITSPPAPETVKMVSGIIARSPLFVQTNPAPKILRRVGEKIAIVVPYFTIPAPVPVEVPIVVIDRMTFLEMLPRAFKQQGTLRGLADMFNVGEQLLWHEWQNWPKNLPVLFVHGTADKVTSHKATEEFFNKIDAEDKKLSLYTDAYHELMFEPEGVKEKVVEECISWVEARLPEQSAVATSKL